MARPQMQYTARPHELFVAWRHSYYSWERMTTSRWRQSQEEIHWERWAAYAAGHGLCRLCSQRGCATCPSP
jgi:hypothetical protein